MAPMKSFQNLHGYSYCALTFHRLRLEVGSNQVPRCGLLYKQRTLATFNRSKARILHIFDKVSMTERLQICPWAILRKLESVNHRSISEKISSILRRNRQSLRLIDGNNRGTYPKTRISIRHNGNNKLLTI